MFFVAFRRVVPGGLAPDILDRGGSQDHRGDMGLPAVSRGISLKGGRTR